MHIRSLKIFCDIVDRRSFSLAATDNGISQSSASQVVHALEERLGVQLLDRTTRPFGLTLEGRRYYEGCRALVRSYETLEDEVRALHDTQSRRLVVASIYSVGMHHMSAFMQRFGAEHPRAKVQLEYLHPHRVYEEVEKGDADLGLVSYPRQSEYIAALPWRSEPMSVVGSPAHPLAQQFSDGRQAAPLRLLDGQPFVAFEQGLAIRSEIDRSLVKYGVHVNVQQEFDNVETMKRAIEAEGGLSILPEASVRREVAAGTLWQASIVDAPLSRPLGIVYRRDRQLSELAQQFIGMLQAQADFDALDVHDVRSVAPTL
ncbi:MAG: LysR family transcriptional regulator [Planctomycetales bacterium]|nr:LysR family transcriptional regulator [Planctomycetales bacterium]